MNDGLTPETRPNWNAADRFRVAFAAADAIHTTDVNHKEAICTALSVTLGLIEDWRAGHKEEMKAYLGKNAPEDGKDEVLPIVKCIFVRQNRKQWTWHANALRQAIAKGKTSDDLTVYFRATPPTKAAQEWSKEHPRPGAIRRDPLEVEITCAIPKGVTLGDKGLQVRLTMKDGKSFLMIPQPRPPAKRPTGTHRGRAASAQANQPAA
jgi:hypothetical protein